MLWNSLIFNLIGPETKQIWNLDSWSVLTVSTVFDWRRSFSWTSFCISSQRAEFSSTIRNRSISISFIWDSNRSLAEKPYMFRLLDTKLNIQLKSHSDEQNLPEISYQFMSREGSKIHKTLPTSSGFNQLQFQRFLELLAGHILFTKTRLQTSGNRFVLKRMLLHLIQFLQMIWSSNIQIITIQEFVWTCNQWLPQNCIKISSA